MPSGPNAENAKDLYTKAQLNMAHSRIEKAAEKEGSTFNIGRVGMHTAIRSTNVGGEWIREHGPLEGGFERPWTLTPPFTEDDRSALRSIALPMGGVGPSIWDMPIDNKPVDSKPATPKPRTAKEALDIVGEGDMGERIPDRKK